MKDWLARVYLPVLFAAFVGLISGAMSYERGHAAGRLSSENSTEKTRHWLKANIAITKLEVAQLEATKGIELALKKRRLELMEEQYTKLPNPFDLLEAKP